MQPNVVDLKYNLNYEFLQIKQYEIFNTSGRIDKGIRKLACVTKEFEIQ